MSATRTPFPRGEGESRFAYALTFKLFKIIFTDLPKIFRIEEYF
jgi:hypothetical protein